MYNAFLYYILIPLSSSLCYSFGYSYVITFSSYLKHLISLRKDTALPSPEWSFDHIALLAEFRCKPRNRR